MKSDNLPHKQGFVDSFSQTTVSICNILMIQRKWKLPKHSGWKGVPKISILPIKFFSPKIVNFWARELIYCVQVYFLSCENPTILWTYPLNENGPIMTFLLLKSDHVMAWDCMVWTCAEHLFSVYKSIWKGYLVPYFSLKARICP